MPDDSELLIAGCDEVGRGAAFGPIVAATVVLNEFTMDALRKLGVKDSKKLTPKERACFDFSIKEYSEAWFIASCSVEEIEREGIEYCNSLVMRQSFEGVVAQGVMPSEFLVDGKNEVPGIPIPQQAIENGDTFNMAIAAASVIAKVYRDKLIVELAEKYPNYDLAKNKGYLTPAHIKSLQKLGMTRSHRPSFCRKYSTEYNIYPEF